MLFVFAGKAHPADEPAQWMIREIQRISSQPPFIGKILLLEGYDMGISRLLVSGVDVWLNTPVHPFEASGTSGMKAAINGTVNLSVLDGWWAEAYDGRRRAQERLGHPACGRHAGRRGPRPPGRDDALRDPPGRGDPALLRARREARLFARVGRALQAIDGLDPARVQQRARAARLLAVLLRARRAAGPDDRGRRLRDRARARRVEGEGPRRMARRRAQAQRRARRPKRSSATR